MFCFYWEEIAVIRRCILDMRWIPDPATSKFRFRSNLENDRIIVHRIARNRNLKNIPINIASYYHWHSIISAIPISHSRITRGVTRVKRIALSQKQPEIGNWIFISNYLRELLRWAAFTLASSFMVICVRLSVSIGLKNLHVVMICKRIEIFNGRGGLADGRYGSDWAWYMFYGKWFWLRKDNRKGSK